MEVKSNLPDIKWRIITPEEYNAKMVEPNPLLDLKWITNQQEIFKTITETAITGKSCVYFNENGEVKHIDKAEAEEILIKLPSLFHPQ